MNEERLTSPAGSSGVSQLTAGLLLKGDDSVLKAVTPVL